ncbi:MAG: RnfH family protein [Rhodoferax sp.]|nr:RnfH family protein [Rhodoferax sp.]
MRVTAVYSPNSGQVVEKTLNLPAGSTFGDAIEASGFLKQWPELVSAGARSGLWGQKVSRDHRLREGDRVELYRALKVDPKTSRRERFSKQGARTAGLFARPGAGPKPI